MRRLGIIACQVFERELAHILNNNTDVDIIYMVRSPENLHFSKFISEHEVKFIGDPDFLPMLSMTLDVLINIMPIGLHIDIDELEYTCNEEINRIKDCTSSILLLYGLCGNALSSVIRRENVKLFYPLDKEGIVDDCICSVLGRENYFEELKRNGSFFLTPGFVDHKDDMIKRIKERYGKEYDNSYTKIMLKANDYKRALIVEEGIQDEEDYKRAYAMADSFELPIGWIQGSLDLLRDTFERALDSVSGL
ncbi:MAG: DUF1638 domain-containing protein [Candidatus Methanofastidiosia archaeon]